MIFCAGDHLLLKLRKTYFLVILSEAKNPNATIPVYFWILHFTPLRSVRSE